jgi:nucleotide-binding universal stress UspA family protein
MYKRILLAYDGSEAGQQALLDCHEIAQWSHAELNLIAVMPLPLAALGPEVGAFDPDAQAAEKRQYQEILDAGVRKLAEAGLTAHGDVVAGDAVSEIAACARRLQADLIVVGHKHLDSWAARWWRGSVSRALVEHSPCSVLVVITH